MKNCVLFALLFGILFAPTLLFAQNGGGPGNQGEDPPHLSPQQRPFSVSYDPFSNCVSIQFRDSIEQATVIIYKDGILLDEDGLTNILPYSIYDYDLWLYGSGLYTMYIRIGERTYAVLEEEVEE